MMHQVEHSKTTNVSPNHKRPFHRDDDESCNDEEEEDGINHLDDLSEMSLMNRSNQLFLNDNSSNMNRIAKEHNNHEGSSSSSVPMMMANNHESTILEPPRKKKISHSHSDHHNNNNYPISSSIHENQQESSHREHMMTLPNHKFQKLFSQPNSIFQLIFKNQWKTLYEFIEELFSKYSWIHSTSEISQHISSIHDTQQFEKISQPSTTISLKQRLQHLSPKYIQMLNQHFIAIPPDAPNLELTLSKAALEYSQECSSVRVPSLMSDHPSVRVPSLRDESSILLSNPHFHLSFRQTCNISELVDRIIESIFAETSSQNEKPKHVLCFGFAKIRPNAAHGISTMTTVQSFFPNSIIDIVKSQEWEILLSLVGDCVMSYILRYCIVLKGTIPRNSFLQICGKPLYHYCQNLKEKKKPLAAHSLKLFQEFEEIMKDERELYNENDHLRNSQVMMMNVRSDIHELDHHHSSSSNSHSLFKKLSTLSHEKEEEELEEEMHEQDDHDPSKPLLLVSESALHSLFLDELEDQQHLIVNPIHTTTTTTTTKTTTETQDDRMVLEFHDEHVEDDHVVMHVIPPRRQRRHQRQRNGNDTYSISECFIPRQVMFYSNKKTPVLGFPQKHMFNTMERSIEGAKKLFNFIFYGKREQPDKRHVKGYGFLLELLLEMKHCQVKHLKSTPYRLSHYCPLKRIQKKKIISNTISISHAEQPLLYKKIEDKNINKHGSSNMVLRMEQLLCTQEENDGTMMVMDTLNSSRTVRDDDADTNSNSRNITIAPQIESEVMLNSSEQFENLVNMTQSYDKVSQFIKSTCKKLIPFELFGSQHNMNVIFHNIDRIVSLGRYETLTLHELMQNIKVNDMKWTIRNPSKNSTTAISTITAHSSHRSVDVLQFKKQTFMAQQFILFLFKHIIMVLLSTHFYITESDQHRTKLLYFRRETWEYINRVSWSKINNQDSSCDFLHGNQQEIVETMNRGNNLQQIETQQEPQQQKQQKQPQQPQQPQLLPQQDHTYSTLFKPIEKDLALQLLKKKSLPYTSVRLLPKQNTARPIINLGKRVMNSNAVSSTTTATTNTKNDFLNPNTSEFNSHSYSINSKLRDLLSVLKFETNRNPELLGSSVFNPLDMYKRLLPFVRMWKEQVHHVSEKLKIFENKENLMLLQQDQYSTPSNNDDDLHLNTQLLPLYIVKIDIKGAYDSIPHQKLFHLISNSIIREDEYISVKYHVIRPYIGKLISKYERVIMCPNQFMRFTKLLNSQLSHKYCKSIFIDQVSYTSVHSNDMNMLLKEHISQNLIKIKNEFYIQVIGIPQGSIVSPLLCSLLYADFERVCLSHDLPGMHSSGGNNGSGSGSGSSSTSHSDLKNSHSSSIVLSSLESMMIGTTSGSSSSTCSSSHNSTSRRNNHVGNTGSASASHSSQHDVNKDGTWNYFSNEDSTLKYFIHVLNSNAAASTTTLTTCESHERVDSSSTTLFTATSVHHDTATTTTTTATTTTSSHGTNFVLTPPISFMKRELVPLFSPIVEPLLHKSHLSTSTSNSSSMNDHHSNSSRTRQNGAQVLSLPQYLISSPPVVFQKEAGQILSPPPPLPQHEDTVSLSNSSNSSLVLVPSIGVLLRLIDDFLYITNNKNAAQYFLERMHTGNPEYGIKINPKKTKVNFETSVKLTSLTLCEYHAEHLIRWCGFNIDTQTLNITVDYSRYWDCHLKDKISRDCRTPGFNLCRKLKQTISWKCTPLVIDGTINSRFTCYLNVYQLFLFVAMKFHTTIRHKMKPQWDKKNLAHMKSAYNLCKTTISDIVGYMWICIQSRKKVIHKFGSFCELEKLYVQYLGVCAFHMILQRKHSHYVPFEILTQLRIVKRNLLASMEETGTKQLMKRVTERRFSTELLNHIQF
ncbi:hypothetical protein C9374_001721 [Naegleria lovaniensis]|uniref:Telomerase reverse transcriptase n=1 Tax=Naegleria lovaniensis TaxID=51637 RepID=A0AA88GWH3_NAELO|nr:uncharacterized protein C9374_001721 [Naegleria lovaniensis]KAG2387389.1 hypothetical protein C9374_001721 [Naegleria lovaniensis]